MEKSTVLKISMLPFCQTNDAYVTDWSCGFNNSGEVSLCEVIAIVVKFLTDTCTVLRCSHRYKKNECTKKARWHLLFTLPSCFILFLFLFFCCWFLNLILRMRCTLTFTIYSAIFSFPKSANPPSPVPRSLIQYIIYSWTRKQLQIFENFGTPLPTIPGSVPDWFA